MNTALTLLTVALAADAPIRMPIEKNPTDAKATKIVFIAGSNYYKPGEHDYIAAGNLLADLVRQTPGVEPVLAIDWPKQTETFANAKAVVFLFDGAEKHQAIRENRPKQIQELIDRGAGLVQIHQPADYPKEFADRAREWVGGAWEKGTGQRAHWVQRFDQFPEHPIFAGVTPFTIDDGWLWKHRFVPGMKGITPLLRTVNPKSKDDPKADTAIVSWAYNRPQGGRSVTFTGAHLHKSFDEIGYRRFLVNGILWSAGLTIPNEGAPVNMKHESSRYLSPKPAK